MTNIVIDSDGDNVIIATNKNPVVICAGIQGVAGINGNGTGASGITGFTNGSGFIGNISAGNLSLTLQDANATQSGQLTASAFNTFSSKGTSNLTLGSTNMTAFQGDLGAALSGDFTNHTGNVSNPHNVTKSQIGLSNVTDVTPLELPVSNATQTALNAKQGTLISGTNIKTINGVTILGGGDMTITGGNVSGIASFTDGGGFTGTVTNNSLSLTLQNANATQSGQVTAGKYTDWESKGTSNLTLGSNGTTALKGNATTADVAASTDKNYVTDAKLTVLNQTSGTNSGDNATNSQYSGLVSNANHTGDATGATVLTLATVNNNAGVFGNATIVPIITVNGKGLVTNVTNVTISASGGSLPVGGTTGQILGKLSATDGDAGWTQSIKGNATILSSGTATDNKLTVQNDGTSDGNCSIVLRRNDADQGAITAIPGNGGLVLSHNHASGKIIFQTGVNLTEKMRIDYLGRFGIGIDTPTSFLHLKAGTTTANTSPMKFEDGVLMTTPEHGAVEFDGSNIWTTISGVRAKNIFSSNNLSALASTTSAQLAGVISDETGTGSLVFGTNCTLNTPNLTTPSAINLTNAVGLPLTTGVSGVLPVANGGVNTAAWVSWTPTFTNFTLGNGTVTAKYFRELNSKTIHYRIGIILGSTSSMGTTPIFSLPVTSVTYSVYAAVGYGLLFGTSFLQAEVVWVSTTTAKITYGNPLTTITATIPFTWTTGHEINLSGTFEAA